MNSRLRPLRIAMLSLLLLLVSGMLVQLRSRAVAARAEGPTTVPKDIGGCIKQLKAKLTEKELNEFRAAPSLVEYHNSILILIKPCCIFKVVIGRRIVYCFCPSFDCIKLLRLVLFVLAF